MNPEAKNELLHAASLLTKAASMLEYNVNLQKEAASTAEELVTRGLLNADKKESYTDYLIENPEKIASLRKVAQELPSMTSGNGALGEVSNELFNGASAGDAFDAAILGN